MCPCRCVKERQTDRDGATKKKCDFVTMQTQPSSFVLLISWIVLQSAVNYFWFSERKKTKISFGFFFLVFTTSALAMCCLARLSLRLLFPSRYPFTLHSQRMLSCAECVRLLFFLYFTHTHFGCFFVACTSFFYFFCFRVSLIVRLLLKYLHKIFNENRTTDGYYYFRKRRIK